jgi:hypothetical protein
MAAADAPDRHTRVPELPLRVLPSSLSAWTSSPSDAAPNRGPECHAESPPRCACGLLHRERASMPTAHLQLGPPSFNLRELRPGFPVLSDSITGRIDPSSEPAPPVPHLLPLHHERLSDGRPPLTASDPAVTATRSAPMPRCFPTSEPVPSTTSLACRRWCPSTRARRHGAPPPVSLPLLRSPKWGPLLIGVLPNPLPHHPRRRLVRIDDHCRRRRLGD